MAACFDSCWIIIIRHSYIIFNPLNAELYPICHLLALLGGATIVVVGRLRVKTQQFFKLLAAYFSESSRALCLKCVKISMLFCGTCYFIYFLLFKFFQILCLDENILLLKLTSLVDMRPSVVVRASMNRYVERVLIVENHFVLWVKNLIKKPPLYSVKCVHFDCS